MTCARVLGPVGLAVASLAGAACGDETRPQTSRARSDAVLESASARRAAGPPPAATSAAPKPPRKLCEQRPKAAGAALDDAALGHVEAAGEAPLGEAIPTGGGKWTWVNLWAGWCVPCKEEMPLLRAWESKLERSLRVVFVSIDDDLRLAQKFLDQQPKAGVRRSYHLPPEPRDAWLETVGLTSLTKLPSHVILDPAGKVRCVVQGAIEERDFVEVESLLTTR